MSERVRRNRRVGIITTVGVVVAIGLLLFEVLVLGWHPSLAGGFALVLAGFLSGPFLGSWLDGREDSYELELARLRRRAIFDPRGLNHREGRRLDRRLCDSPRIQREQSA